LRRGAPRINAAQAAVELCHPHRKLGFYQQTILIKDMQDWVLRLASCRLPPSRRAAEPPSIKL
jgi:hypothetical protein